MNTETIKMEEGQFQKGDWVELSHTSFGYNPKAKGSVGFVSIVKEDENIAKVVFLKHGNGSRIRRVEWVDIENLSKVEPSLEENELHALIDMALDMNDQKWFLELTERLPKELVGW